MYQLNKKRTEQIKRWLETPANDVICPFNETNQYPCRICSQLFPEVKLNQVISRYTGKKWYKTETCPCGLLPTEEVVKRAKEWVK